MKKGFGFILIILIISLLTVSCSSNTSSKILGKWRQDRSLDISKTSDNYILEFKKNGLLEVSNSKNISASLSHMPLSKDSQYSWEEVSNNEYLIKDSSSNEIVLNVTFDNDDENIISISYDTENGDNQTILYEKN